MVGLVIREARFEDMDFLLSQAKEEGWNPGICDALPFYKSDPNGFFIGYLGQEKVGCISATAYNKQFGFIGFYIVRPTYRHQGFGLQLWQHALTYLGKRTIGLDGVLTQQQNYERSHFKLYYKNHRFKGIGTDHHVVSGIVNLKEIPMDVLLKYDTLIFGLERKMFLKHWVQMPNAYAIAKIRDGQLLGYGVLRSCYNGFKIGPLFANQADIAMEIFQSLCAKGKDAPIFLDIPEVNPKAMQLAASFHLTSEFATVRMYNKPPPKQQLDKVFGVTTFELG